MSPRCSELIKNSFDDGQCLYKVDATTFELLNELELDPDEDAPMTMGVHTSTSDVVCGINSSKKKRRIGDNQNCRVFGTKDDQITKKQTTSTLKIEDEEVDDYQKATAFSEENDILAVGSTNNEISLLSFPSLTPLADPFKIPKEGGDIFDLGFLGESVMVCGSKSIYFVSLPGDKKGSEKLLRATSTIGLPSLPSLSKGTTCSFRSSRISKPKDENEVTTLFAVVNTTPPRSARGGARSAYVCVYSQQGEANEWILGRTKSVSNKAITVFDIK
ncbi:hypothetical protein FRB99_006267 [Tulasnella sp. 403]|nr:hypothetical protein FRB99_006267 [Tulasnella sp. 403]